MDGEKTIRVNMELPISELTGMTALLEQLRQLIADHRQLSAASTDAEQSTSFDTARFQALRQEETDSTPVQATETAPALPREPAEPAVTPATEGGSTPVLSQPDTVPPDAASEAAAPAEVLPAIPEHPTAAEPQLDEHSVSAPAAVPFFTEQLEADVPRHAASSHVLSEEQAIAAAQPVTAEAMSLSFRRDDRRYDNGFPLY